MAGPDIARAEDSCRNATTQSLQCRDDDGELPVCIPRDVFAEQTTSPAFIEDADNLVDEEPIVVGSPALSGDAVGLAGVARHDAIHRSAPSCSVEGGKVRPDSRLSQVARFHARDQDGGGVCFPLKVSDAAASRFGDVDAEPKSADAGTQFEGM